MTATHRPVDEYVPQYHVTRCRTDPDTDALAILRPLTHSMLQMALDYKSRLQAQDSSIDYLMTRCVRVIGIIDLQANIFSVRLASRDFPGPGSNISDL